MVSDIKRHINWSNPMESRGILCDSKKIDPVTHMLMLHEDTMVTVWHRDAGA